MKFLLIILLLIMLYCLLNNNVNETFENNVIRYNHWDNEFKDWLKNKNRESSSGAGSSLENTKNTTDILNNIIKTHNINSILDLPCGDMHWISNNNTIYNINYTGMDISKSLIQYNQEKYKKLNFKVKDIIMEPLHNAYDLIFSRDFFIHLNYKNTLKVLKQFKESKSKYLLTNTYINTTKNDIIDDNGYYPINLEIAPFNLPKPIKIFKEIEDGKYLGLWLIKDI